MNEINEEDFIDSDIAKVKIGRYKYWVIKDEKGVPICSSDDENCTQSFAESLDELIRANVDSYVQVKYGSNEPSTRNLTPVFIRINKEIKYTPPKSMNQMVNVNGVAHPVDRNGNVNIQFQQPEQPKIEHVNTYDQRMITDLESRLSGIQQEMELKEKAIKAEMMNELSRRDLEYERRMLERDKLDFERKMENLEMEMERLEEKKAEIQGNLKGYLKEIPSALGGLISDFLLNRSSDAPEPEQPEIQKPSPKPKKRNFPNIGKAEFTIKPAESEGRTFEQDVVEEVTNEPEEQEPEVNPEEEPDNSEH